MVITLTALELGSVTLPETHPRADAGTCPIRCFVIDHPDGLIVVDTGPRAGHPVIDELYRPEVVPIVDALNDAGFDERRVTAVVNTHLHFDHCGQNEMLAPAPVWITAAERDVATTEFYTVPEWAAIEPARLRLAADNEVVADGVTLLHTPGHTPGHVSVSATTNRGFELIVGQACWTCAEFASTSTVVEDMHEPEWHAAGLESIARLRALAADHAHFSHDPEVFSGG